MGTKPIKSISVPKGTEEYYKEKFTQFLQTLQPTPVKNLSQFVRSAVEFGNVEKRGDKMYFVVELGESVKV